MRLLVAIGLAFALATSAHAGSFYLSNYAGLTGSMPCDNQIHEATWVSPWNMNITSTLSWIGVDKGGVGDVWFFAEKLSDGQPLTFIAWDHYRDPTGLHQFQEIFNPPFFVGIGDGIRISYFCQPNVKHMQVIIKAQYQ